MKTGSTEKKAKKNIYLLKSSVFTRVMLAGLLPTILIFVTVFILIGNTVYKTSVDSATERAVLRAEQASQLLGIKLSYLPNLLSLTREMLLNIDRDKPDAMQQANEVLLMFVDTHPDIYNTWFVFEDGMFGEDGRYRKSYVQSSPGVVEEVFDMSDDVLDDPEQSPWYNEPLSTGNTYIYSLDYYDYGDESGELLVNAVAVPITRIDGQIIGCLGADVLFDDEALGFIRDMELENERKALIFREDGLIMYSSNEEEIFTYIDEYPFKDKASIQSSIENGERFIGETVSPFFGEESLICVFPINIENDHAKPYFYLDMPINALHGDADRSLRIIVLASALSLFLAVAILYVIARNIVRPIRSITESANRIADGNMDETVALYGIDVNEKTENEIHILGAAINKMLSQLNDTQRLKLKNLELKHKKEKAETQSQAKGDFLARMSHEIRTPLNAIIGITELVLREETSPVVYEHVQSIKSAGSNLLSIINDILDLSKIESGKLDIVPAKYIFASLINDVINIIRIRTAEKTVTFVVNLDSAIPNNIIGDEVRVRQVLLNLLSNAVKYTNEGFISLTIDGEILEDNTVLLGIEVADSGIGIRPEDMNKLFGNFVQVDMASHKGVQGTGLGLAITRSLCNAMGGDISVYSQYGEGSTFTVKLPQGVEEYEPFATVDDPSEKKVLLYETREIYADSIACSIDNLGVECLLVKEREKFYEALNSAEYPFVFVSSFLLEDTKKIIQELEINPCLVLLAEYGEVVADIKTIAMPVHSISIANILNDVTDSAGYGGSEDLCITFSAPTARVLIVDDISTNLKVAEGLMAPYNMIIDTALSGELALEKVKSEKYDVVFMDHMMPEMDGLETTRRIRAMEGEYYANIPIVALTANAISGVKEIFLQNGMNDFLPKPIDTSKLNSVLEQWIPREKKDSCIIRKVKSSSVSFEIEGLNVNAGITGTGGSVSHYFTTLSLFHKDSMEKITQIKDCVNKDMRLYITFVHALKSGLASIGAAELSELAKNLEDAGRGGDMEYISQNTDIFLQRLEELLNNIKNAISQESGQQDSLDKGIDKELLIRLKSSLDEMDATATGDIIKELQSKNVSKEIKEAIENIYQNFLLFEYDAALSIIDELLADEGGC